MSSLVQAKWVQLGEGGEAQGVEAVAHEVLDGLDVVAGDRLFLFQPGDLVGAELLVQGAQGAHGRRRRRGRCRRASGR